MNIRRVVEGIQNMTYDATQDCWVAIGHSPEYRRAGRLARFGKALISLTKAAVTLIAGFWVAVALFTEAPWYTRLWSAICGDFPIYWPF